MIRISNTHGLTYMVSEYLKINGVPSACVLGTQRGSHGVEFYAEIEEMDKILNTNNHQTYSHNLYFSKLKFPGNFYCSCVKKHNF